VGMIEAGANPDTLAVRLYNNRIMMMMVMG
jgi:hypothetical protein